MYSLLKDLRYGWRLAFKKPAFTLTAVFALALGIGANTAIFSVINAVLLRPLQFAEPDRLVWMWGAVRDRFSQTSVSPLDFLDYREQNKSFEQIAAAITIPVSFNLTKSGEPLRLRGAVVTTNYFDTLGIKPALGRTFVSEEEQSGRSRVAILSYRLWEERFGADPSVINKTITLDGETYTVVGVMPAKFRFPQTAEIWTPMNFSAYPEMKSRAAHFLNLLGKLKPGVTLTQAQSEMNAISSRLEEQYPNTNTKWYVRLVPLQERIVGDIRPTLMVLLGAVGFVLLIACANVANLLLVNAASRQKEIAIRTALGASRWRIVRQMLAESLILALFGGALGMLLAIWGVDLLPALSAGDLPRANEINIDQKVLGFTLGISLLTGLFFGLAPAWQSSRSNLNESLKEGGRNSSEGIKRHRMRSLLVIIECALAVVLLIGAGLLIKSFIKLQSVDPGFDEKSVLSLRIDLSRAKYQQEEQALNFFEQLQQRVAALPGVEAVGMTTELPLAGQPNDAPFYIEGRPPQNLTQSPNADFRRVNHDYFRAMRIPLVKGRYFTEQEVQQTARVAIISSQLARRFFPNEDPIGQRLRIEFMGREPFEIVGIVGDIRHRGLNIDLYQTLYLPDLRMVWKNLVIRTSVEPLSLVAAVRKVVSDIDPDQPLSDIKPMEQWVSESVAQPRFRTLLLGIFAFLALTLSVVGIYGVMSFVVVQRTQEIGIRVALGAQTRDVLKLIIGQGIVLTCIGVAVGLIAALGLTRLMSTLLFQVSAKDPLTFGLIVLLLIAVALLACYIPARRATKVDPIVALRSE